MKDPQDHASAESGPSERMPLNSGGGAAQIHAGDRPDPAPPLATNPEAAVRPGDLLAGAGLWYREPIEDFRNQEYLEYLERKSAREAKKPDEPTRTPSQPVRAGGQAPGADPGLPASTRSAGANTPTVDTARNEATLLGALSAHPFKWGLLIPGSIFVGVVFFCSSRTKRS
jgi:hypothetical protein